MENKMTFKTKLAQIALLVTLFVGALGIVPVQGALIINAPRMGDCGGTNGTCT
jgi:hypothetical protein